MSLIDLASLVLAPTATKEGKVYSAIPDTGEGDMTFSRGSSATRINSAGLIEKERSNLLLQSNTFNTTWTNTNTNETGGQSGYDGSNNAWKLSQTATSGGHYLNQSKSQSGVNTLSIYAKADEINYIQIASASTNQQYANFDLSDGSVGNVGTRFLDAKITSVGNGWYRLSVVNNGISALNGFYIVLITSKTSAWLESYSAANATDGLFIQDAQLEQGLVATNYIPTTTSAVYEGITDDVPRVDYSGGGCPSLKLEPQRSNLLTQSEYFGGWDVYRGTLTANDATSPEGVDNAYRYEENSDTGQHFVRKTISMTSGTKYTASAFVKADEITSVKLGSSNTGNWNASATFNLSNGSVSSGTGTIENYGNGWYRCIVTANCTTTATIGLEITTSSGVGSSGDGLYIYGAMVEAGSYVSSYIPTYSVSSTRVADSCVKTGISELIGQSEGTFYVETKSIANDGTFKQIAFDDGTTSNLITIDYTSTDNQLRSFIRDGGTAYSMTATITDSTAFNKIAIKAKDNDFAMWVNGTEVATSATATYPNNLANIEFDNGSGGGLFYGNVKQMILFPTALTDTQLEEITK